jgi:quinoprotein glucose dehydrogenase
MQQFNYYRICTYLICAYLISGLSACTHQEEQIEPVIISVTDEEAEEHAQQVRSEISPFIADGLDVSLWASESLVSDPVALHVDHLGRVLLTTTERRRNAELDIRGHRDWMIESTTFETVEDRRDFVHRILAPERSEQNTWLADHNEDGLHDWRDLTVNKESIFRLEDLSGNGLANQSRLFIRDFHEEITDVAGAVLYHEGDVFLGVSPDLWRIRDTTGDGYGDVKESISHGYGVNIGFAGHGMSGLVLGPDGRIYWSIGDVGMSVTDNDGERWHSPRQGVIVRSEPDGSNFEVYAKGFRNTHEFVFDKYGNLITVDNDGDHAGEFERLIYVVNGSDSGWRLNWQFGKYNDPRNNDYKVLMDEQYYMPRFEDQAAHLLPPLAEYQNGPAGMAYNPGTALSEEWKDHFFVAEFVGSASRSGIHAFTLEEDGASFRLDTDKQVMQGILATGIDFGPDGALYFADWIEGWTLNQEGRVWKIDTSEDPDTEIRNETKNLLSENFNDFDSEELIRLLEHQDMRIRNKAQFELAARDDIEALLSVIEQSSEQLARIHGIWGIAQIGRRSAETPELLIPFLEDQDSEIRAQAAKMLGDVRYEPAGEYLIPLLRDENARVRFFATEALGRISWHPALQPIIEMLENNNDEDVYLRHGGAIALERIGDAEALTALADHPSRAVRIAAVVALYRMEHPGVERYLHDDDEFIVTNAARAINDDTMIEEAIPALAAILDQVRFTNEPLIRRAINANLYEGTLENAQRLGSFANHSHMPENLRIEALNTLAVWPEPSVLDRVTGDPRGEIENNSDHAHQAIEPVLASLLSDPQSDIRIATVNMISSLDYSAAMDDIADLLENDSSASVRIAALQALAAMNYHDIESAVLTALEDSEQDVRMNALLSIPDLNLAEETIVALITPVLETGTIEEQQTAYQTLGNIRDSSSYELLRHQFQLLQEGNIAREVELDLMLAIETSQSESLNESLQEFYAQMAEVDSVSAYHETLYGGDAVTGQRIFYQNASAQCIRCHVVNGQGSEIGPDLTHVAERLDREEMLQAMVNPNARISPGYGTVTLTLQSGEIVRGLLLAETSSQITVQSDGQEQIIDSNHITERINSPSGMPAMGDLLSREELRDLVEFMSTLSEERAGQQ